MIALPFPPSANALFRAVGGRAIKSEKYRAWIDEAGLLLRVQHPKRYAGPVRIAIAATPPDRRRRDLDNTAKAVLDLLTAHAVIRDDDMGTVQDLRITVGDGEPGVRVVVEEIPDAA